MTSGPDRLDGEPSGPSSSLIRHRWLTAAGTTATVAAMSVGGLALIKHPPATGPRRDCGLVRCSATLPSSVRSAATGTARAPGSPGPAADPARSAGPAQGHAQASPAAAAGSGRSADHQVGVQYQIKPQPGHRVTGHLVIVNHGGAPVTGWQLRVVLPGDGHYQVAHASSTSAGDSLVVTALPGQAALGAGRSVWVEFSAVGSTAAPASVTVRDAAATPAGAARTSLGRSGRRGQFTWPGTWWLGPRQHGDWGWPAPGAGGWPGPGPGGWPGGR